MINLEPTKDEQLIKAIYYMDVNPFYEYIVIRNHQEVIGLFEIQPLTRITGILHLHIMDKHQTKGYGLKAFDTLFDYLKGSKYVSLISGLPVQNKSIFRLANKTKAKCCGLVKNGIIYNKKLQDLVLFQLEVS